ncbi:MAG: hypothetical protein H6715_00960 [Myxococcales bacterium]|nr:hypothetical protein [Myxococcales bacterium]MCB9707999.1 hypothetical protein [Myxococcales bacterium]
MSPKESSARIKGVAGPVAVGMLVFVLMLILGALGGFWWLQVSKKRDLVLGLRGQGRLVVLGDEKFAGISSQGTTTLSATDVPDVYTALRGGDEMLLRRAMQRHDIRGILVGPLRYSAIQAQERLSYKLINYAALERFRGEILSESAALYLPYDPPAISPVMGKALARLARRLLLNDRPPPIGTFPHQLSSADSVEVMVMIRNKNQPQLWRSARGSSVARALLTASEVAKERWAERSQAMGGNLSDMLGALTVEVWLLSKDGTLMERTPVFINHVFKPEHGVAYEHKTAWRYMLPEFVHKPEVGSAVKAYQQLFRSGGEPESSAERRDIRIYRLRAVLVGTSAPNPGG